MAATNVMEGGILESCIFLPKYAGRKRLMKLWKCVSVLLVALAAERSVGHEQNRQAE